jgi:hypothetical protein
VDFDAVTARKRLRCGTPDCGWQAFVLPMSFMGMVYIGDAAAHEKGD